MDVAGRSGEMGVFGAVAEHGSLSAAARALGLTPSAVSRIVARIEARLGVRLLVRTTRALALTAECGSAWKRDPGSGVIGVEKGPLIPVV